MEKAPMVLYYRSMQAPPVPAVMLLYHNAIQLYDESGENFIGDFSYAVIEKMDQDNNQIKLYLDADRSQYLSIPRDHFFLPELLQKSGNIKKTKANILHKIKMPFILLMVVLLLVSGYLLIVSSYASFKVQFISPRKEAELGQLLYHAVIESEKIDTQLTSLISSFAKPLHLSKQYKINITVVDKQEINAFALPGGNIIIYKSLLEKLRRPEELVALLSHESIHINERHSLRNIFQEMSSSELLSIVFGRLGQVGQVIAGQANMLRSLSYSRGLEEDADELGMQMMVENKIDPKGMVYLMERLEEANNFQELPAFLSTHPVTASRKAVALQFSTDHPFSGPVKEDIMTSWNDLRVVLTKSNGW